MEVKYIYNDKGQIESAVIPLKIWNKFKIYILESEKETKNNKDNEFNPEDYKGLLSHYNFDIEHEIENIKEQWKRNI